MYDMQHFQIVCLLSNCDTDFNFQSWITRLWHSYSPLFYSTAKDSSRGAAITAFSFLYDAAKLGRDYQRMLCIGQRLGNLFLRITPGKTLLYKLIRIFPEVLKHLSDPHRLQVVERLSKTGYLQIALKIWLGIFPRSMGKPMPLSWICVANTKYDVLHVIITRSF